MIDETEDIRRSEQARINVMPAEELPWPRWTTDELSRDFEVAGFAAPYVVVRRRSDGKKGTLEFTHSPRFYFNWREHNP